MKALRANGLNVVAIHNHMTGGEPAVWVFDLAGARPPRELARGLVLFGGLAFSPDGGRLAVSVNDAVEVYRTGTWERTARLPVTPSTGRNEARRATGRR